MLARHLRDILGIRPRVLARGESVVAWAGLGFGAIVLALVLALGWWSQTQGRAVERRATEQRARIVLDSLGDASRVMLARGELSGVRALFAGAATSEGIGTARLVLPDARVLASTEPHEVNADLDSLEGLRAAPEAPSEPEANARWSRRLDIPGLGPIAVEVEPSPLSEAGASLDLMAGTGVVAVVGLVLLLMVYHRLRKRLGALGAVRDALVDLTRGERDAEALLTDDSLGPVAGAWNELIRDREALRTRVLRDHTASAMSARQGTGGELRSACDALWLGLIVVDERTRITYANGAAAVFLQTGREELVGSVLTAFTDHPEVSASLALIAAGESCPRRTIEIERSDPAPVVLRLSIRALRREDAGSALIAIEDVTQQRVASDSRSQFVAQATHELRAPLTNIRLYVEEMQDLGQDAHADRARCLNVINQETRRLDRVVSDMLSVSEIEAGALSLHLGDVRLEQLLDDFQQDYQAQSRAKGIELSFELPPKLPVVRADREKLSVAMHNLVGNAIKYTPEGGRVDVKVRDDAGSLVLEVSDTGFGISEEDQERVFQRFFRVGDERVAAQAGTGIGLALAREIARLHGGDITLESVPEKGSTFTLAIPLAEPGLRAA